MKQIIIFFTTSVLLVALISGFIFAIDPYDKYGINVFGFQTKAVAQARENKFMMLEHAKKKYDLILIGSSASHRFHTDDIKSFSGLSSFNYAVQHTTPEDYLAIVNHVLTKQHPKVFMIQLDFPALSKNFPTDPRFHSSPLKKYLVADAKPTSSTQWFDQDYFTLRAINDSFKVVWVNYFGKVRHLYEEDGNYHQEKDIKGPVRVTQHGYEDFELDEKRMEYLREIKRICDREGIKIIAFTTPYSAQHIQEMMIHPHSWKSLAVYKEALAKTFGHVYDFANVANEKFSTDEYYSDSTHAKRALTENMLKVMFNVPNDFPSGFGHKIIENP